MEEAQKFIFRYTASFIVCVGHETISMQYGKKAADKKEA
jgi:hypothetical protein